jgi:hypothetical protein
MNDSPIGRIWPSVPLARWLSVFSSALLVVFLAGVLTTALPPRLMDPQWQLALAAALMNNATVANATVALVAVILLLVPLQGYASWRY